MVDTPEYKTTLTVADLDKAANQYEAWIDEIVKNPAKETAALLVDLMDALDALNNIRDDLEGVGNGDEPGDK